MKHLAMCGLLLLPAVSLAQTHCSQMPELTPDSAFPRCTGRQLARAGFPDHKHAQHWYDWQVLTDASGETYGPGSLCQKKDFLGHDDLVMAPGEKHYHRFVVFHNPGYADCDMLALVELLDWANHAVPPLLGLSVDDTLTVFNPDNTQHYKEQTGLGVWRLYQLKGNKATIEPYPVLMMRTLDGHAAFMLVTDWLLHQALPQTLPLWLHQGLVEYMGEDGTHLVNYMGEFRGENSILFSAPLVDALLSAPPNADEGVDREMFRRACYSAYLMVWQLVEYEGGLTSLRDFLGQVAEGVAPDAASRNVYGADLAQLASLVDAVNNGEPAGKAMKAQRPHEQP